MGNNRYKNQRKTAAAAKMGMQPQDSSGVMTSSVEGASSNEGLTMAIAKYDDEVQRSMDATRKYEEFCRSKPIPADLIAKTQDYGKMMTRHVKYLTTLLDAMRLEPTEARNTEGTLHHLNVPPRFHRGELYKSWPLGQPFPLCVMIDYGHLLAVGLMSQFIEYVSVAYGFLRIAYPRTPTGKHGGGHFCYGCIFHVARAFAWQLNGMPFPRKTYPTINEDVGFAAHRLNRDGSRGTILVLGHPMCSTAAIFADISKYPWFGYATVPAVRELIFGTVPNWQNRTAKEPPPLDPFATVENLSLMASDLYKISTIGGSSKQFTREELSESIERIKSRNQLPWYLWEEVEAFTTQTKQDDKEPQQDSTSQEDHHGSHQDGPAASSSSQGKEKIPKARPSKARWKKRNARD